MTGSTLGIIVIMIVAVLGLLVFEGLVLFAAERPYFKHPRPDPMTSKVRGGVHLGDPRSLGAPQGELVREAVEETMEAPAGQTHAPEAAERGSPQTEAHREREPAGHGRHRG